jgi:acyl dehydratase
VDIVGHVHTDGDVGGRLMERAMTWEVTEELVHAYSRRGNFHSDAETAAALGMPGLVAQGVQVAGPAYGMLLDAWGEDFLAHGEIDLRFVGMVVAGDTIEARIEIAADLDGAAIEVTNTTAGRPAVVGQAQRGE